MLKKQQFCGFYNAISIILGKGRKSIIKDYKLNRYACYLIAKNGGTMPEELPTPKKSLKQLEKENKKFLRKK